MAGSAYTHGTSILIHKMMEPSPKEISHTLKDNFDFVERKEKTQKSL